MILITPTCITAVIAPWKGIVAPQVDTESISGRELANKADPFTRLDDGSQGSTEVLDFFEEAADEGDSAYVNPPSSEDDEHDQPADEEAGDASNEVIN